MPEVGIVAEELTCGNAGDEMVVIKVSDCQLNPCPLVVVFPYCLGSHINLIMTDDLIFPPGKEETLSVLVANEFFHHNKIPGVFPCVKAKGEGCTQDSPSRVKGFEVFFRDCREEPFDTVLPVRRQTGIFLCHHLKEETIPFEGLPA